MQDCFWPERLAKSVSTRLNKARKQPVFVTTMNRPFSAIPKGWQAVLLALACLALAQSAFGAVEPEARRDSTVEAVECVTLRVVNIATESIVEIQDAFADIFHQFYEPYRRRQKQRRKGPFYRPGPAAAWQSRFSEPAKCGNSRKITGIFIGPRPGLLRRLTVANAHE